MCDPCCNNMCKPCMTGHLQSSVSSLTFNTVGEVVIYTFILTNTSSIPITDVSIAGNRLGLIGTVSLLLPGQNETFTVPYTVTQADIDNDSIVDMAIATGDGISILSNRMVVTAQQQPAIAFTKNVNPSTYSFIGDVLTYIYTIINTGNVTLTGPFIINDNKIGLINISPSPLAPGQILNATGSYSVTPIDLQAGSVINQATVTEVTLGLTKIASAIATYIFAPFSVVFTGGTGIFPVPLGASSFDAFLVGGGGAGGAAIFDNAAGGGGGAGASLLAINNSLVGITGINFSIGTGGTGVTGSGISGNDGTPTIVTWGISNILTATGGMGGFGGSSTAGGTGGNGNNNGGGGGGAGALAGISAGIGGASNPGDNATPAVLFVGGNGGTGGTGSASNFNVIFSNLVGIGGTGGPGAEGYGGGGGGGGGIGATDSSIGGGNPISLLPQNGQGGTGYGAGGGALASLFSANPKTGAGGPGVLVIIFR